MTGAPRSSVHRHNSNHKDAVLLGQSIQQFLNNSGIALVLKHPRLHRIWQDVVGAELAARAEISALRRSTLEIAVGSSAVMQEISFRRDEILRALQERIRKPYIAKLVFVVQTEQESNVKNASYGSGR